MGNGVKRLAKVKINHSCWSPLLHWASCLIREGWLVRHFSLINPWWLFPMTSLYLIWLEWLPGAFDLSPFNGIKWSWLGCGPLDLLSCPSCLSCFYPVLRILPLLLYLFKDDNDWLHDINSLSTQKCILPGPMDLCLSSTFKCFLS